MPDTDAIRVISIESLQALQLIVGNQRGIFSPNLRHLDWYFIHCAPQLGPAYRAKLSPYMLLFLGHNVTSINVGLNTSYSVIHITAVRTALEHAGSTMEHLEVLGLELLKYPTSGFPWNQLQHLHAIGIFADNIPRVATLPRLKTFQVTTIVEKPGDPSLMLLPPVKNGFPYLQSLEVRSYRFSGIHILRHLSPANNLERIVWKSTGTPSRSEVNRFIDVVGRHCTPNSFVCLKMAYPPWLPVPDLPPFVDIQPEKLDFSPLFHLKNMETVDIDIDVDLRLTPDLLSAIPDAWPRLRTLSLCPTQRPGLQLMPSIGAADVAQLVCHLPSLELLGLVFDGTKFSGGECNAPSVPPSSLHTLRVGCSPIDSPLRIAAFLKANFPKLSKIDARYWPCFNEKSLHARRWEAVQEALEETRA